MADDTDTDADTDVVAPPADKPAPGRFSPDVLAKLAEFRQRAAAGEAIGVGDDEVVVPDDAAPAPAAAPVKSPAPAAKPTEQPAAEPPPPQDAAATIAARDAAKAREAALAEREAAIIAREKRAAELIDDVGGKLVSTPLATMRQVVAGWLGQGATDDEIDAELSDVLTTASLELAGAKPDPADERADMRKMRRELRQHRALTRREQQAAAAARKEAEERAAAAQREAEEAKAIAGAMASIKAELTTVGPATPFLALEDDAPSLVWDLIRAHHERTGEVMPIAAAAKKLDAELANAARTKYQKLAPLLQSGGAATTTTAASNGHQGDQPRRSRPLSTVDASEDSAPPAATGFLTPAQQKQQSIRALRGHFAKLREAASGDADY